MFFDFKGLPTDPTKRPRFVVVTLGENETSTQVRERVKRGKERERERKREEGEAKRVDGVR